MDRARIDLSPAASEGWNGKTVLITGGLGFVGSSLAHALVDAGARVRVLDALLPLYGGNWYNLHGIDDEVDSVVADIRDSEAVTAAVRDCDAIYHLAAQTSHVDSMTEPFVDADMNVRGMLVLLEALREHAPGTTLINIGTRAQYGAVPKKRVDESGPFNPTDVYGASKHCAEQYARIYQRAHGLDVRCARVTNSFGPRHQMKHGRYGILNWFLRLALDDEDLTVYGEGRQLRDFLYIDDLVDALLRMGSAKDGAGSVYNIGTGSGIAFGEMAHRMVDIARRGRVKSIPWPEERKKIETGDFVCDPSAIEKATGWSPRIEFGDALARTVEYYDRTREHYW